MKSYLTYKLFHLERGRMKKILIFVDRDKTLIYDKKCHYGSQKNWKSLIRILPFVVKGVNLLRKIPNVKIYMITNQPGVAIKDFPLLTLRKSHEVCKYVLSLLKRKNARIDGYEICEHAPPSYVKAYPEFKFHKNLIGNFSCMKPKTGMINNVLKNEKLNRKETTIYVIGDRFSDVKTALNVKGFGIIVPFANEKGEKEKVKKINNKNTFIAKSFLDAAKFVVKREE